MSAEERLTSEFWEKASAALDKAPQLRSASRELRSNSELLRARNLQTNLTATNLAAHVAELSLRIARVDEHVIEAFAGSA